MATSNTIQINRIELIDDLKSKITLISKMKEIRFNFDSKEIIKEATYLTNLQMDSDRKQLLDECRNEIIEAKKIINKIYPIRIRLSIIKILIKHPISTIRLFIYMLLKKLKLKK